MHAQTIRLMSMCECKIFFLTAIAADARTVYWNGGHLRNKLLQRCIQSEEYGTHTLPEKENQLLLHNCCV